MFNTYNQALDYALRIYKGEWAEMVYIELNNYGKWRLRGVYAN